jgi:hypothetical protein
MHFTWVACNELLKLVQLMLDILVHEERVLSCTFKMVAYYLWLLGFLQGRQLRTHRPHSHSKPAECVFA